MPVYRNGVSTMKQKSIEGLPQDGHDTQVAANLKEHIQHRLRIMHNYMKKITQPTTGGFEARPVGTTKVADTAGPAGKTT